jgi:hypothetical protein
LVNLLKPDPKFRNGYKDPKRMEAIHDLPCLACKLKGIEQRYPTEAHHKIGMGLGLKASDLLSMPLCDLHHSARFIRREDSHLINTWAIHKSILSDWESEWGNQDELIEITNKLLEYAGD